MFRLIGWYFHSRITCLKNTLAQKIRCQSSQPRWSAHRDPSFGHAILTIESPSVAHLKWYRNVDGVATLSDSTTYERLESCANIRRLQLNSPISKSIVLEGDSLTSLPNVLVALGFITLVLSFCVMGITCMYHKMQKNSRDTITFGRLDETSSLDTNSAL